MFTLLSLILLYSIPILAESTQRNSKQAQQQDLDSPGSSFRASSEGRQFLAPHEQTPTSFWDDFAKVKPVVQQGAHGDGAAPPAPGPRPRPQQPKRKAVDDVVDIVDPITKRPRKLVPYVLLNPPRFPSRTRSDQRYDKRRRAKMELDNDDESSTGYTTVADSEADYDGILGPDGVPDLTDSGSEGEDVAHVERAMDPVPAPSRSPEPVAPQADEDLDDDMYAGLPVTPAPAPSPVYPTPSLSPVSSDVCYCLSSWMLTTYQMRGVHIGGAGTAPAARAVCVTICIPLRQG